MTKPKKIDLTNAILTYTKLEDADLRGAILEGAIFPPPPPPVPDQIPQDLAEKLINYGWHNDREALRLVGLYVTTVTIYGEESPNTAESLSLIENYWGTVAAKRDKDLKEFFDNLPHR